MNTMKAMQVKKPGRLMELVEVPVPVPAEKQVLIEVETCGVCNGDSVTIEGNASHYPRIPGHEVIGTIAKMGSAVKDWTIGQRVGIGFHAGNGDINGSTIDGGYAEYMLAKAENIVAIPESISSQEASPLMCAGETTFSALLNSMGKPGDLVAIQGIGGLGHLAVQYAKKLGFETAAISRGTAKKSLIEKLGADHYIDSSNDDPAEKLKQLGGAKVIVSTAPSSKAIKPLLKGLKRNGQLLLVSGSRESLDISPSELLGKQLSITGSFTDGKENIIKMLRFSVLNEVKPMIELFPLEEANQAYQKMKQSEVQFRAVLKIK